jgi:hypothetical protein
MGEMLAQSRLMDPGVCAAHTSQMWLTPHNSHMMRCTNGSKSRKHKPSALIPVDGWELEHSKQDKDRLKEDNQQSKKDRDAIDAQLGFWSYNIRESDNKERKMSVLSEKSYPIFYFSVF